jgi:hypothetical protein
VQSFQSFPFRDFLQNPPTSRQKGNPKADTRTHPEKKAQKTTTTTTTTTQFLKMENPKSSPRTQSPTHLVGKKQGTLAKETKLTGGLQSGDALKVPG